MYIPGQETSEFKLTALLQAIGALLVFYGVLSETEVALWIALIGTVVMVVPGIVYTIARTWYKAKAEFGQE